MPGRKDARLKISTKVENDRVNRRKKVYLATCGQKIANPIVFQTQNQEKKRRKKNSLNQSSLKKQRTVLTGTFLPNDEVTQIKKWTLLQRRYNTIRIKDRTSRCVHNGTTLVVDRDYQTFAGR